MASGIYAALSGAMANEARVEIISHNLANANTVAFQGFRTVLETAQGRVKTDELTYAAKPLAMTDTSQGPIMNTDDPMDLAFASNVYMGVEENGRQGYVRGATLVPMEDGRLLTTSGQMVMGDNGAAITIPANVRELRIHPDGTVMADGAAAGQLKLVRFENEQALQQAQGTFIVDPGGANPESAGDSNPVMSGYLEMANRSAVKSTTSLIMAQNSYSASLKMIETLNAVEKKAASELIG